MKRKEEPHGAYKNHGYIHIYVYTLYTYMIHMHVHTYIINIHALYGAVLRMRAYKPSSRVTAAIGNAHSNTRQRDGKQYTNNQTTFF